MSFWPFLACIKTESSLFTLTFRLRLDESLEYYKAVRSEVLVLAQLVSNWKCRISQPFYLAISPW